MKTLTGMICVLFLVSAAQAQQKGIVNNTHSRHVQLKSTNIGDCRWTDGFWGDKFQLCEQVMVPHMGRILKGEIGFAYDNFKIAAGLKEGVHQGFDWHDGDFYKWMEACVYLYAINQDEQIVRELDEIIDVIALAQRDDGYLSTQTQIPDIKRGKRERFSSRHLHEMYNSGHLMTAACIHKRVTGQDNFFNIAKKHADFLVKTFMPCPDDLKRFGFNQTQIMGLVEMYRDTGNQTYLKLAEDFVNRRGKSKVEPSFNTKFRDIGDMVQERTPLRKAQEAVGHAVLALYFYAGAADIYAETGERDLIDSLDRMWDSVVNHKMYITGACGQTHHGASSNADFVHEAFIKDYMMPNSTAYNETCANICNAMFSYRLLGIHGESKYADVMERVLYNSALSGISQEGTHYFYTNPLRRTFATKLGKTDYENRADYIPCFCCPPNLVRTVAKLSNWAYSHTDNGISVNLYGSNELDTTMLDGSALRLKQQSDYPWDGRVRITIGQCKSEPFDMMLRIPGWAEGCTLAVNGNDSGTDPIAGRFAVIHRQWKKGDVIQLEIPLETKLMVGHPQIEETRNQTAIQRGPVVYCMETPDLPEGTSILDVYVPSDIQLKPATDPKLTDGCTTLIGEIMLRKSQEEGMYTALNNQQWKTIQAQFIPYYAWSNRGTAEMSVWLPLVWSQD